MSFEVWGLTAEILEAGIIVQGCWQESKFRVAYSFAGVGNLQKGREHWKEDKVLRTNVSGRIEESIKSIFLRKKGNVL